jgi:hypothetical protein
VQFSLLAFAQERFIMALSSLKFASFLLVVLSAEGLRTQRGVTGDPSPPPYPVVNVHVSEPTMGADDFKLAAIAHQHEEDSLLKLEEHISSMEEQTLATMKALAQEVQHVGDMIDFQMQA